MAKKEDETRAEITLDAVLKLIEEDVCNIRVDGKKVRLKLDIGDMSDDRAGELWSAISDEAQNISDECFDVDELEEDELEEDLEETGEEDDQF
jgi:hypothetical protein